MEKRRMTKLTALILAICLFVSMQMSGFCVSATETEGTTTNPWEKVLVIKEDKQLCITDDGNGIEYATLQGNPIKDHMLPARAMFEDVFGLTIEEVSETPKELIFSTTSIPFQYKNNKAYVSITDCNNNSNLGIYIKTKTISTGADAGTYIVIYKYDETIYYNKSDFATLIENEFESNITSYVDVLNTYDSDNFYVNYIGEREDSYNANANDKTATEIAQEYNYLNAWKRTVNAIHSTELYNSTGIETLTYSHLLGSYNDNIPVFELQKNDGIKNKPLVVVQHGLGGNKTTLLKTMRMLSDEGYCVIAIDSYCHGERTAISSPQLISTPQIALRTALDLDVVLDYYEDSAEKNANTSRFAMVGESMGALATYNQLTFGKHKPVVAVPIVGTPDIVELLNSFEDESIEGNKDKLGMITLGVKGVDVIMQLNDDYEFLSPIDNFDSVDWNKTAILAINGECDEIILKQGISTSLGKLNGNNYNLTWGSDYVEVDKEYIGQWSKNQKHIYNMYKEVDHAGVDEMRESAVNFIKTHLNYVILKAGVDECVVDGNNYTIQEAGPVIKDGQTFLPLRSVITNYWGWNVGYDSENNCVMLTKGDNEPVRIGNSVVEYIGTKAYLSVELYERILEVDCHEATFGSDTYILMTPKAEAN